MALERPGSRERIVERAEIRREIDAIHAEMDELLTGIRDMAHVEDAQGLPYYVDLAELSKRLRVAARDMDRSNATREERDAMQDDIHALYRYIGETVGYVAQKFPIDESLKRS